MTRTSITLPTRLQLLSFFLVVDNVVKSVISRLNETAAPVEHETATQTSDDVLEAIADLFDDVAMLREDLDKQKRDASFLLSVAALNGAPQPAASPLFWPFAPAAKPESSSKFDKLTDIEATLAELNRQAAAATHSPTDTGE